ncbi:MAG TPA: type II toxin-antitoxin system RelE/ParE family toxin [Bacteroidales bacterium]|nr:type II toxin-antitoxin system RelE/ParE family toxin [Bacteroidales bacterium]
MKFKVEYNPDFYIDIAQAVDWYNEKQAGLGDRLLKIIKQQTAKLAASALHFEIKYDNIRCMRIEKFPYMVHYRVNEQTKTVKVEAMLHTSRNPENWNERS